jgi:hypothetical protein
MWGVGLEVGMGVVGTVGGHVSFSIDARLVCTGMGVLICERGLVNRSNKNPKMTRDGHMKTEP